MKFWYKSFLLAVTGVLLFMMYEMQSSTEEGGIVLNEICSNNFTLVRDESGGYSDYIELYNPGQEEVWLEGYYLSDDEHQLQKYALERICIPAAGYSVIWLDGQSDTSGGQVGFKISRLGEEIFLSDTGGNIIDSVVVPELSYNTCYGRAEDGGEEWRIMTATSGSSNEGAEILPAVELDIPVFNKESGFYKEPFELSITAAADEEIYYTLDGSDPSPGAMRYEGSLEIEDASEQENVYAARTDLSPTRSYVPSFKVDKATIVRAVSYNREKDLISEIVTRVYFVGYDQQKEYENLPVISLVTDADNLFDPERGIYTNGQAFEEYKAEGGLLNGELLDSFVDGEGEQRFLYMASNAFNDGKEWEREASFTYFDENHQYCFTQNVGIRVAGQSTRATPKKSFSIYGRSIYDENTIFPYEFFPGTTYSSIKLRNGGNNNDTAMITDAFLEELALPRNVSVQRSRPCILFLNGEYWGIYNIRERYKEEYLRNHFGVSEGNVWIVDSGAARVGGVSAQEAYENMVSMVTECDLSFDDVYEMICGYIDIQSLIDYCCINLYVNNTDVYLDANTAVWRTVETEDTRYGDGKWRWMLFDLDVTLQRSSDDTTAWMEEYSLLREPMVESLMKNAQFRRQFCLTFMDIANTAYAYDTVHGKLMEWKEVYEIQTVKSHQRFFDEDFTQDEFDGYMWEIDEFFRERFPFAMESLAAKFGLTGSLETLTVLNKTLEGGTVMVNTAQLDAGEWKGQYFTDYPLSLTAVAKDGYRFVGWQGDVAGEQEWMEISVPAGGLTVEAVFEKVD